MKSLSCQSLYMSAILFLFLVSSRAQLGVYAECHIYHVEYVDDHFHHIRFRGNIHTIHT